MFVNDTFNISDVGTKYISRSSPKMTILIEVMRSGILRMPLAAFIGRISSKAGRQLISDMYDALDKTGAAV